MGSEGSDQATRICMDLDNNIYCTGTYGSGPHQVFTTSDAIFQNVTLPIDIHGIDDVFLAKYNQYGIQQWVKRIGNLNNTSWESAEVFSNLEKDKIYLYGKFQYSILLDTIQLTGWDEDLFISQIDTNGKTIWAKKIGGVGVETGGDIAFDENRNLIINFVTYSGAIIDTFTVPAGIYYAKLDSLGNCLFVKNSYELSNFSIGTIPCFKNHKSYVSGYFTDTTIIDSITLISNGGKDIFIASYDENFNLIWLKTYGLTGEDQAFNIAIDDHSNLYVAGYFTDSITFDGVTYYGSGRDLFLAKFDSLGINLWFKSIRSNESGENYIGRLLYSNNLIYFSGGFSDSISFDSNVLFGALENAFVSSYSINGEYISAITINNSRVSGLIVDEAGAPILTGSFNNTANLGSIVLNSYGLHGLDDAFIAKHDAMINVEDIQKGINKLFIYPNPANEEVHIQVPEDFKHSSFLNLSIIDNVGRFVKVNRIVPAEVLTINISMLSSGMYRVLLSNNNMQFVGKMILSHQ
jgi:hypothetical protein